MRRQSCSGKAAKTSGTHPPSERARVVSSLLIAGLALAVRGAVWATAAPAKPTAWETESIVQNLLAGKGFTFIYTGSVPYRAYKPPLYEWITAGVYLATGRSQGAMIFLQCLFGALLAAVCFFLGRALFGTFAGGLAGILAAVHPPLVYYDTHQLHALSLSALLIGSIALTFLKIRERGGWGWGLLGGALIGLAAHERGTAGIFLPVGIAWLWAAGRRQGRPLLRTYWPILLGFLLVVTPWTVRNGLIFRRFVFMTSLTGELFWRGNNPMATGTTVTADLTPIGGTLPPEFEERMSALDEIAQQQIFRQEAWSFIRAHPGRAAFLFARKLAIFWWFSPTSGWRYPPSYLRLYAALYLAMLLLCLYGLLNRGVDPRLREDDIRGEDDRQGVALLIGMAAALSVIQSVYYVEIRHRWAVEPLLLVLAAAGLARLLIRLSPARRGA